MEAANITCGFAGWTLTHVCGGAEHLTTFRWTELSQTFWKVWPQDHVCTAEAQILKAGRNPGLRVLIFI